MTNTGQPSHYQERLTQSITLLWHGPKQKAAELGPNRVRQLLHTKRGNYVFRQLKKQQQRDTLFMLLDRELGSWRPMEYAHIRYTSYWCGQRMDEDNIIGGMKYILDAVVLSELLINDSRDYIKILPVEFVKVPHKSDIKFTMEIIEQ